MSSPRREYLCKVLVVGDLGVGKTSIIQRYVHNIYSHCYRATIGVDFAVKIVRWERDTMVRLQLWDIAGQERFGHMTRLYYRQAAGALVVCDLGRAATLHSVHRWKEDLDSKVSLRNGNPIPTILIGNKCDVAPSGGGSQDLEDLSRELGFTDCHMTSAKENVNIDDAMSCLIKQIIRNMEDSGSTDDPAIVKPSLHHFRYTDGCSQCCRFQ
ncbi:PREDICTED: ras-related protein Rab-38-like [Nanorana parkeri]|uniref:ras-related protein Rab-38-like n=1 Tax=Nanorana parkeri TaxID=125878 RepID=UPI0008547788|nr:PREDICTED: ras-related protein Rab-38-like [Nanorana parkeri]